MYTPQQKYTNNNDKQRKGGIDSINTTFDFFPFFVMEFYLSPLNAILPPILCITLTFVFKTHIAGLTPFNLLR